MSLFFSGSLMIDDLINGKVVIWKDTMTLNVSPLSGIDGTLPRLRNSNNGCSFQALIVGSDIRKNIFEEG